MRRWRCTWLPALGLAALFASGCRDSGDIKVDSLKFYGVHAFDERRLKDQLATHASGWLPWAQKAYFDRREFDADLKRLIAYYADRGYPNARVTSVGVDFADGGKAVNLSITIEEGQPILVDRVVLTGFEMLPATDITKFRSQMAQQPGAPRDLEKMAATRDAALHLLRESGYAHADVEARDGPTGQPSHVIVEVAAAAGPMTYFGPIDVTGLKSVKGIVVHRAMRYAPGEPYRESLVVSSQRRLMALQVFDFVHVKTESPPGSTTLPTVITVTEATRRRVEFGVGYGTEDHLRASVLWRNVNLGGAAQQFSAIAKWSSTLSGVSFTYAIPYPFRRATSADGSAYAWWNAAPTYDSETYGGTLRTVYRLRTTTGAHRREGRDVVMSFGYRNEFQRYELTESGQDLTFSEKISLGFDPITGKGSSTVASLGTTIDHIAVDRPQNPTSGYSGSFHYEYAAPWLGGTLRFDEARLDLRGYYPIARAVIAGRMQIGSVFSQGDVDVNPVSTRYYLGGTTSMRGWSRYEVAPLSEAGEPIGGRSMLALSAEFRKMIRGNFGAVLFVDAGNVWENSGEFHLNSLEYNIGPGVRWNSPVGIVRADFGWQLTPIAGLMIDGEPVTRRWRVQISIGQAF